MGISCGRTCLAAPPRGYSCGKGTAAATHSPLSNESPRETAQELWKERVLEVRLGPPGKAEKAGIPQAQQLS